MNIWYPNYYISSDELWLKNSWYLNVLILIQSYGYTVLLCKEIAQFTGRAIICTKLAVSMKLDHSGMVEVILFSFFGQATAQTIPPVTLFCSKSPVQSLILHYIGFIVLFNVFKQNY